MRMVLIQRIRGYYRVGCCYDSSSYSHAKDPGKENYLGNLLDAMNGQLHFPGTLAYESISIPCSGKGLWRLRCGWPFWGEGFHSISGNVINSSKLFGPLI